MIRKLLVIFLLLLLPAFLHAAAPSGVALKSSAAGVEYGHSVTFTATVSPASATGHVTFYRGTMVLETEPVSKGVASFTTTLLPSGGHSFTAYYSGDNTYASSTSPGVSVNVKTVLSKGFAAPIPTLLSSFIPAFAVGDFNGDGKPDLAAEGLTGVAVLLGNGDGTFAAPIINTNQFGFAMVVADFNGDGKADLAIQNYEVITVLLGNGDGTFQAPVSSPVGAFITFGIVVGDFNHDGKADLAMADSEEFGSGIYVLLGNGDGTFQPAVTYASDISMPNAVAIGDFNGDGNADIAVGYFLGVNILLGNGDGTFQNGLSGALITNVDFLAVGDFNGDGKADLALDTLGGAEIELGNGDGTFQAAVSSPSFTALYGGQATMAVCDFNGDGKLDIVGYLYGEFTNEIGVALGNGDGTFQAARGSPSAYLSYAPFALADFNGDGRVDMVQIPYLPINLPPTVQLGSAAAPSTTALSSSLNPSQVGESVTLMASVLPATSAGSVVFYSLGLDFAEESLGKGAVTGGLATVTLSKLPGGTANIYAVYEGDTKLLPSQSNVVAQQVNFDPDSITLSSSPNPSSLGQTVTLVATVRPAAATGTVFFEDGGTTIGQATLVQGKATFTTSTLSEGTHSITAAYGGSSKYGGITSTPISQIVN